MVHMKFSIVIPTYRRNDLVRNCITSLLLHEKDRSKYEIIVVDDGVIPEDTTELKRMANEFKFHLTVNPENVGFPNSVNVGASIASGEFLILCNNDIIFTHPVLDAFEEAHKKDATIQAVGCKLLFEGGKKIQHGGVEYSSGHFIHTNLPQNAAVSRYCISVTFALVSIKADHFGKVGGLNPDFFIACDDVDFSIRTWQMGKRVYYDAKIQAIHLEGATRGKNPSEKVQLNEKCFYEERKSLELLNDWLTDVDLQTHINEVSRLNSIRDFKLPTNKIMLEVGCGYNPQPGYQHLDVRPLPHVEYVCDFSKEPLPLMDGSCIEILSNHSIEHVSYRKIPFILREWHRVLEPEGRIFMRTPDLKFICEKYLAGEMTPESHGDEKFLQDNFGTLTPSWWANLKLYAGQDYDSNFHFLCFDFETLKNVLERYGFHKVERVNMQPVYSPGELQVVAFKK